MTAETRGRPRPPKRQRRYRYATLLVATAAMASTAVSAWATPKGHHTGQDAGSPVARAQAIVAKMTLDQKITELHGLQDSQHQRYVPGIPSLGIPPLVITNGPAGVGPGDDKTQQPATALPAPISLAASWDTTLASTYGDLEGEEAADLGNSLLEGPDINIARVPQNGRTFEAFGEDPYLTGALSAANIRAVQSKGVIDEVKHFDANNQETNRFTVNEVIDQRTLHEIYLPAFQESVQQGGAQSVMCAYPQVNGEHACQNTELLTTELRDDWHFDGFIGSDFGATNSTVPSANAGLDLEMPSGVYFTDALKTAVQDGQVSMSTIDTMLVDRFAAMIRLGLFDHPLTTKPIPAQADGAMSRQIAEQGMVLLRDDSPSVTPRSSSLLPLDANSLHSVAVIGPYAGAAMTGGGGSSHVDPLYTVSPVTGIQNRVGSKVAVNYNDGSDIPAAVAAAKAADVAVVMVGDDETEGKDRPNLSLSGNQDALVEAVAAANPRTVVVVKSGGPVLMPWANQVPAILEAWYPGEEDGNAVAAVLFGDVNPSGKLPITFPVNANDVPANTPAQYPGVNGTATYSEGVFVGYRHYDEQHIAPLFPFGFGLSYTNFAFSHLHVVTTPDDRVLVTADVTNVGRRSGSEVAQLYVGDPSQTNVPEPPNQLEGFAKVTLAPGQTKPVSFQLTPNSFSYYNATASRYEVAGGTYQISVGDSSRSLPLHSQVRLRPATADTAN